ncbi:MAG: endonuclease III [Bacilli bacterium]|nr:endonuclease III [Bacilli bacterium]
MTTNNKINEIISYMDTLYPNVGCELNYHKDYELVIAVMLSAQTKDSAVNAVTAVLFNKYPTLEQLADTDIKDIEEILRSIGLYKNKAKNLKAICHTLLRDYDGKVPEEKNVLQTLPGVGNKTAGVIRAEIFHIPELPVDTHILRISKRLKLTDQNADATETEQKLKRLFPKDRWIKTHHQLIHFGRYTCTAKNPQCENCKLSRFCTKK